MHWTAKAKQRALIVALGIILMVGIGLASCNRPTPAHATTPAPASTVAHTATPVLRTPTPTPSAVSPTSTPRTYPTATYIATAMIPTWTAIPTATMAATATIATNPATVPPPPISPITGHPTASDGVPLAQLAAITAGIVMVWLAMYGRFKRRR